MKKGIWGVMVAAVMIISMTAFAAEEIYPITVNEDHTFSMEKTGQNMEGEEFVLTVTGTINEDGSFVIDGLYDGEINLIDVASEEQLKADEASVAAALAALEGEDDGLPGTYTDGEHTLIIADDLTFTMEKTGQNMEGEDFTMLVTGKFSEDGTFVIEGLYDGEINLVEVASEEQLKADYETVQKAFDGGKVKDDALPGTYTDGEHTLIIADDLTFTMEKTGQNMEGEDFTMLVTGKFSEDGTFVIEGLYDGEINLVEVASEEQLKGDYATVQKAFEGGKAK